MISFSLLSRSSGPCVCGSSPKDSLATTMRNTEKVKTSSKEVSCCSSKDRTAAPPQLTCSKAEEIRKQKKGC
jgi:hypothetical protein